jgi:glycosyltransferase involved in cell wall biosynthesis
MGWELPAEATVIAEDPLSVAAVAGHPRSAVTVHYLTALDRWGLKRLHVKDLQDLRAERRAPRGVAVTAAYSDRVARRLGRGALAVPAAIEIPARTLVLPDQPVATCVADWSWAPNRAALGRLLAAWPLVRAELPAARLLLAGYGDPAVGVMAGVSVLGAVADSAAVLAQACVLVFPCPATSGPKVKVMEAASLGVPVLTTPAGLEGLRLSADAAALVAQRAGPVELAAAVVDLLRDPGRRAAMATRARADLAASHAPEAAARVRLACVEDALSAAGRAC